MIENYIFLLAIKIYNLISGNNNVVVLVSFKFNVLIYNIFKLHTKTSVVTKRMIIILCGQGNCSVCYILANVCTRNFHLGKPKRRRNW